MSSYKDLEVWQHSINLSKSIYYLVESFPQKEQFRLIDQMCRAAVSIPSNIPEGRARKSDKDFMRFIAMSLGSLAELNTQLLLAVTLGYASSDKTKNIEDDITIIGKRLQSLYSSLKYRAS